MVNRKRYSLSDVIKMDQYLMSLAAYEASEGMLSMPYDMESALKFQSSVTQNFRNFKNMIKRDECTINEIEQMVVSKHGPIINPYRNMTTSQVLEAMANEPFEEQEEIPNLLDLLMEGLKSSLPSGTAIIPASSENAIMLPCHLSYGENINSPSNNNLSESISNETEREKTPKKLTKKNIKKTANKKSPKKKTTDGKTKKKNEKRN
ncbi:MAG: hypothetical protein WC119_04570 [Synergistaceae bacterium]